MLTPMPSVEFITALAGVPMGSLAIYFMYRLAANHMSHNTEVIADLSMNVQENTYMLKELYGWLRGKEDK